jgi:hypothetical protein
VSKYFFIQQFEGLPRKNIILVSKVVEGKMAEASKTLGSSKEISNHNEIAQRFERAGD